MSELGRNGVKPYGALRQRMAVILDADAVEDWLNGTQEQARVLMGLWPDGRLTIAETTDVDWDAS